MPCPPCGRMFHSECYRDNCDECHGDVQQITKSITGGLRGQPVKNPEDIKDPYSTGRKRAAIAYPLFKTNPCEWRGKKNCGGGLYPIVGCIKGKQQDRHHGPIKNPLRNEPGNVHRICKNCHAQWHALNDPDYDERTNEKLPHEPQVADDIELMANELEWKMK